MKLQIKSHYNSTILFEGEADNIRQLVEMAVKNKVDLSDADLRNAKLNGADLTGANLFGADFNGADLTGANLLDADLRYANFNGANLSGANLSKSSLFNVSLIGTKLRGAILPDVPKVENLDNKILKAIKEGGKLDMDKGEFVAVHCWAIHLAGQKGKELENRFGTSVAGALIYHVSTGYIRDYYATEPELKKKTDAMHTMKKGMVAPEM